MIRLFRDDEYALMLEFDLTGSKQLVELFNSAFQIGEGCIQLGSDSFFDGNKSVKDLIINNQGTPAELFYSSKSLIVQLDRDIIEFCIERLKNSFDSKDFFPSEICDLEYMGNEITLYGIFV